MDLKPRFIKAHIQAALRDTPVVFVNGPRQAGKSTLMKSLAAENPEHTTYCTLDDLSTLDSARKDPHGFLNTTNDHFIIDEVQRAPELFLAIKLQVDERRQAGRFLLTGSANIFLVPKIADSLAGRLELLSLNPFSLGELQAQQETLIDDLFSNDRFEKLQKRATPAHSVSTRAYLLERITQGGFPSVQERASFDRQQAWFQSYLSTLIERDIRELAHIEGLRYLPKLLQLLATRSACLLNFDELARSSALAATTLKRYFILLQTFFLIHTLPAWSNNFGKRLVKSPKVYIHDTGLLCHLLGLDQSGLLKNATLWGSALETFVINELIKIASWSKTLVKLYHYRTNTGLEVDLVLEAADGRIVGIEIKATHTPTHSDFKGLRDLKAAAGNRFVCGVLLHLGHQVLSFEEGLYAAPLLRGYTL